MRTTCSVGVTLLLIAAAAHADYFVRISDLRYQPTPPNPIRTCGTVTSTSPLKLSDGRWEIELSGISGKIGDFLTVEGDWDGSVLHVASSYWGVTEKPQESIIEISYGKDCVFPQYCALHTDSGYFRMIYGPESGWGTSIILPPVFWSGGRIHQSAPVNVSWRRLGRDLLLQFSGVIETLSFSGTLRLMPPAADSLSAEIETTVEGDVDLDVRPGEAFKLVTLSSMHVSADEWDAQSAYIGPESYAIPPEGWIVYPAVVGSAFGLKGGTSAWKLHAPTIDVILDRNAQITGWVTASTDPNDDNVSFWAADDNIVRAWRYRVTARP